MNSPAYIAARQLLLGSTRQFLDLYSMNMDRTFSESSYRELALVIFFYLFMAMGYYLALVIDVGWLNFFWPVTLNHATKAVISLPVWWLFFRRLASWPIWKKVLLHVLILPVFTYIWMVTYYQLCDQFGFRRMQGSRRVWDFYITALFYLIQFGNFHLYTYYKKLRQQQLLAAQLGKLTVQSELSALKAQLNPHFLYNVFNTINAAIPSSAKHARQMINKLSDLFRHQLKASREELVTVREELEFVRKYLELEKERFQERLDFEIHATNNVLEDKIPPMIFQPLVENAVKHGLSPLIEGGKIELHVTKEKGRLRVIVRDTGVGIDNQQRSHLLKQGIGLANTNERLEKMYGRGLEIVDNQPRGLAVRFSIPMQEETISV